MTDIVEPGGGPGGSDRLFEAKVVSPCTLAERQGAEIRGQKPSKRGYLFGFGNTEESYRIMIYGTAARGLPTAGHAKRVYFGTILLCEIIKASAPDLP